MLKKIFNANKNKMILLIILLIILAVVTTIFIINYKKYIDITNKEKETLSNTLSGKVDNANIDNSTIISLTNSYNIRIIKSFDENVFKGKKSVIFFWASWCTHCDEELELIKNVLTNYQNRGYNLYLVSHDKDIYTLANYVKTNELNYEVWYDQDKLIRRYFDPNATTIPLTFVIDENCIISASYSGSLTQETIDEIFGKL